MLQSIKPQLRFRVLLFLNSEDFCLEALVKVIFKLVSLYSSCFVQLLCPNPDADF